MRARAAAETPYFLEVGRLAVRLAALPWLVEEPVGEQGLRRLMAANGLAMVAGA